jgi:hypothetical protein
MKMDLTVHFIFVAKETNCRSESKISNHLSVNIPFGVEEINKYTKAYIEI